MIGYLLNIYLLRVRFLSLLLRSDSLVLGFFILISGSVCGGLYIYCCITDQTFLEMVNSIFYHEGNLTAEEVQKKREESALKKKQQADFELRQAIVYGLVFVVFLIVRTYISSISSLDDGE